MRTILIDRPWQHETSEEPFLIDGKVYYWQVSSESSKLGENLRDWLLRKEEYISARPQFYADKNSILIYDIHSLAADAYKSGMIIRYALITT